LSARLGAGVVVRSDDIDGYDIIGTVTRGGETYRFRAHATDDGEIESSELDPV
jgi:hypothetical protein